MEELESVKELLRKAGASFDFFDTTADLEYDLGLIQGERLYLMNIIEDEYNIAIEDRLFRDIRTIGQLYNYLREIT